MFSSFILLPVLPPTTKREKKTNATLLPLSSHHIHVGCVFLSLHSDYQSTTTTPLSSLLDRIATADTFSSVAAVLHFLFSTVTFLYYHRTEQTNKKEGLQQYSNPFLLTTAKVSRLRIVRCGLNHPEREKREIETTCRLID
jgi:hypothetical protein